MAIRSHRTKDTYMNRPLTHGGSHRRTTPSSLPEQTLPTNDPCEACKRCPYKRLVEKALNDEQVQVIPKISIKKELKPVPIEPSTSLIQQQQNVQPVIQSQQKQPNPPEKVGLFTRFSRYVAKNQAANKAAGDTSVMEDLMKYGAGITKGAARLGQEEIEGVNKKKSVTKSAQDDDELLDFLSGKRPRK